MKVDWFCICYHFILDTFLHRLLLYAPKPKSEINQMQLGQMTDRTWLLQDFRCTWLKVCKKCPTNTNSTTELIKNCLNDVVLYWRFSRLSTCSFAFLHVDKRRIMLMKVMVGLFVQSDFCNKQSVRRLLDRRVKRHIRLFYFYFLWMSINATSLDILISFCNTSAICFDILKKNVVLWPLSQFSQYP